MRVNIIARQRGGSQFSGLHRRSTLPSMFPVAIAVVAAVIHYFNIANPISQSGFTILLAGYLVLLAGNMLEGV
jgi:hypothetical protein